MAKWPLVGVDSVNRADGAQAFGAFGGDHQSVTESETEQWVRDTYTASNLRVYLSSWSGEDLVFTLRINGGNGNLTENASGTGEWEDAGNTDSLVSNDLINVNLDQSAGMHGDDFNCETYQITLDASSDVPPIMGAGSWAVSSNIEYHALQGALVGESIETNVEYTMRASRILRDLRIYVTTYSEDMPVRIRKNQADGNLIVTATGTGEFLDTTNTDSFVAGDEANYEADGGNGAVRIRSVEADTSSGVQMWADVSLADGVRYLAPSAEQSGIDELWRQVEAEDEVTIQNFFVNCVLYSVTHTIRTRKNIADGNLSVSATGTGIFENTSDNDSLVAEDDLAIQQESASTGDNGYLVVVEWETGGEPLVPRPGFGRPFGHVGATQMHQLLAQ